MKKCNSISSDPHLLLPAENYELGKVPQTDLALEGHPDDGLRGGKTGDYPGNEESAVIDHRGTDDDDVVAPRKGLQRGDSRRSARSHMSGNTARQSPAEEGTSFTPSLSRRPSDIGKVEEDVCYPMLEMREAGMGERGHSWSFAHAFYFQGRAYVDVIYSKGCSSWPSLECYQNFPFPFDFAALEAHCSEEREKNGVAIPRAKKGSR